MKMADVLRNLADKLDSIESGNSPMDQSHTGTTVEIEPGNDSAGDTFVPPLQAKLELLKKSTGVPSFYDNDENGDELDDIKKLTGIKAVVAQEAGEDNDITG
jgi:hypothetical protein